ncbi:MAG: flagellar type III secretion system protein FlhB [Pseudotabrizicola sp.]|uniref:EscU/YscU/HrcU family type III secretion system export apparatus switch protein n=1 Tax=Pseudotabrizicola sp. TaxID=2939647 RepID=UPI0027222250|nr:flagellar type III secretion system protein FlhB [Pseudotabrizicola sp.]MDO8882196.1 flagellar type III secretion system protein FlhB [Pseudotabrizicola sp.]MDP2082491.1 flagellar type III secretion system protein FlhB [Pseudotabrizicola sp.]MDZ7572797.1 flagellar type III secretion system protein FlhB [Pseudotabrizicola sp.]
MSNSDDQSPGDKEHDPSEKKLADARRKGDIAKSTELLAAAAYTGLLLAGLAGDQAVTKAATTGRILIEQAPEIARLATGSARTVVGGIIQTAIFPLILLLFVPAVMVVLALIAQRAIVFAPDKLVPKLSRISPLATAKKKFGAEGLFEFAKNFAKLMIVAIALGWFLTGHVDSILATATLDPRQGLSHLVTLLAQFLVIVILVTATIGAGDLLWQRHALLQRNRMSRKELMDEMKESDGDPHAKSQRRQRGQEIAMNQMLADVVTANVVIVNPTHFAVALKWNKGARSAPIVVAKGVDEIAQRIRKTAAESGVPIHSDPPTARSLFATVDIGKPIGRDQYRAVAAAIRFADAMRKRARDRIR